MNTLDDLSFGISLCDNIRLILQFTRQLLSAYRERCECGDPVLDMDSQLPLTIYCILGCKNSQLKPIISLLGTYLESEDTCENEKRSLAALNVRVVIFRLRWSSCGRSGARGSEGSALVIIL